ncbi:MAG: hypothetical protein VX777_03180 [Chlamydiota bacterium]|nr:hypothetical protein [Chlamydiota bacterium]
MKKNTLSFFDLHTDVIEIIIDHVHTGECACIAKKNLYNLALTSKKCLEIVTQSHVTWARNQRDTMLDYAILNNYHFFIEYYLSHSKKELTHSQMQLLFKKFPNLQHLLFERLKVDNGYNNLPEQSGQLIHLSLMNYRTILSADERTRNEFFAVLLSYILNIKSQEHAMNPEESIHRLTSIFQFAQKEENSNSTSLNSLHSKSYKNNFIPAFETALKSIDSLNLKGVDIFFEGLFVWACQNNATNLANLVLPYLKNSKKKITQGFLTACENGALCIVKTLYEKCKVIAYKDHLAYMGVVRACRNKHQKIIEYFFTASNLSPKDVLNKSIKNGDIVVTEYIKAHQKEKGVCIIQ